MTNNFPIVYNLDNLEQYINSLPKNSVIFIDIDDTIITPQSSSFRVSDNQINIIDKIKKNKDNYPNYEEIISNWRLSRKIVLLNENWPNFINKLKQKYLVFALTKIPETGKFGNIESIEKWRYEELKSLNIEFSQPSFLSNYQPGNNLPTYYNGIFITGKKSKSETISQYLSRLNPSKIVLIDDKLDNLQDISDFCISNHIQSECFLYREIEAIKGTPKPEIMEWQFHNLIQHEKWFEDDEYIY